MIKKTKAKSKLNGKKEIQAIHHTFISNLNGLEFFIIKVAPVLKEEDVSIIKQIDTVLERTFSIAGISKDELKGSYNKEYKLKLSEEQKQDILKALKSLPRLTPTQVELLYRSSFVMLISYFDFLLSDLLHYYYSEYPESVSGKDIAISLDELKNCSDINDAIDFVINKRIESVLYKNLEEQKRFFKETLKIDIKENIILWNVLNEAIERRNLIVHNNGKVNRRYLENADLSLIPEGKKNIKLDKSLCIDKEYFILIFNELLVAGIMLIQCCWRKWRKNSIKQADEVLNLAIYDLLLAEKWAMAERLGLFSKDFDVYNKAIRLTLDINYCQSLKWQNKKKEMEKELEHLDMSTLSPKYVVALSALKSDKETFFNNIDKAIVADGMTLENFVEWPLFREFRADPTFEAKVKASFTRVNEVS